MKKYSRLPDSELEVMLIIWDIGGTVSTSEIMEKIGEKKTVQVIQTYLGRLEEKGFLQKEKKGRLNYYTPLVGREAYRLKETHRFVDTFYKNAAPSLFSALLKDGHISPEEMEELKAIIDESGE